MRPLGCTPYPHHSPVGVGLCVCASAGSFYSSKLIKSSDRQVWVMWLKHPHEPLQGPNQVIDFSLIKADWNASDEMDFCSLTDIKVKEQSVENMMRWAPNTSSWLFIHVHTRALLSHDQRHAHSHTPASVKTFCSSSSPLRGKKIYEPSRFMTVAQAADQLIQIIQRRREEGADLGEWQLYWLAQHITHKGTQWAKDYLL